MKRKPSVIQAERDAVGAELVALDAVEQPTEDEVTRSAVALEAYEALDKELTEAHAYETKMEAIRSAAANPANREGGAGIVPGAGPYIKRTVDPYEGLEMVRANRYEDRDVITRAQYAIEQAPKHLSDKGREHVMSLVETPDEDENRQAGLISRHILMTGSKEYHQAFRQYMRNGWADEVLRATMTLTDANGGYLVPFTLDPTIILTNAGIIDPLRQISTIKQIATDSWNGVTSAGVTSSWTAEGGEMPDASPGFGQPTITPKRADTWVEGTYEMLADSGFATQLGPLLADAKARHEGEAFATANTGATRPRGVIAAVAAVTASIVTSAATNAFARGDVDNVGDALRPRDAAQASWLANKRIYTKIRQFDTAGGSAFWADMGMGRPANLLGQPQYEASSMQSAVTTGGLVLLAGNFEHFVIVDRVGMSVQFDPMLKGANGRANGKAGWAAFWRVGSDVVDPAAFRLLQLNATAAAVPLA